MQHITYDPSELTTHDCGYFLTVQDDSSWLKTYAVNKAWHLNEREAYQMFELIVQFSPITMQQTDT
jgi:hypothetical protein